MKASAAPVLPGAGPVCVECDHCDKRGSACVWAWPMCRETEDGWTLAGARVSKCSYPSTRSGSCGRGQFWGRARVSVGGTSLQSGRDPGVWVWPVWPVGRGRGQGLCRSVLGLAGLVSAILVAQPATEHVLGLKMYVACPNGARLSPGAKILKLFLVPNWSPVE